MSIKGLDAKGRMEIGRKITEDRSKGLSWSAIAAKYEVPQSTARHYSKKYNNQLLENRMPALVKIESHSMAAATSQAIPVTLGGATIMANEQTIAAVIKALRNA